jgi:hypothetical protein
MSTEQELLNASVVKGIAMLVYTNSLFKSVEEEVMDLKFVKATVA